MKRRKPAIQIVNDNADEPLTGHDRATLADLVEDYRGAVISRASFVRGAAAFGLSATTLSAILAESAGARPVATPKRTAKLNIGVGQDADTVDPQAFKTIPGYYMMGNLYDQLIDLRPRRVGSILRANETRTAPMIARSMTVSRDRLTATFRLDPRARFEDGSPMTTEDVLYTFRRGIEGTQYTNTLMGMLTLNSVKQIRTPDSRTVVFRLGKPNPMLERLLSLQVLSIQSAKVGTANATKKDKFADAYWRTHVFANGPYVLKSWDRGEGFELAPNPNYWRKQFPKNGGLVFRIISDPQERLNLLKSGALHVAFEVSAKDAAAIRAGGSPNAKLVSAPSPWNFALTFNNKLKPLDDKRVRQALSYAVPYEAIIKNVMFGLARPSKGIIVPGMPTAAPGFWRYNTDLNKAKQMLEAAGLGGGFDTSIDVLIGRPEDEQAATLIQANFQQIGVRAAVNKVAEAQYQDNRNNAKSPMQIIEWFSWVNDPMYHMFWNMYSKNTFTNSARYANPQVDKLVLGGIYEPNAAKRERMSRQAQQIIVEEAPWAFLFARDYFSPVSRNLHDYPLWPDQNPRFYWTFLT
jgi:peptide/nickel transport system substrate-binding protein